MPLLNLLGKLFQEDKTLVKLLAPHVLLIFLLIFSSTLFCAIVCTLKTLSLNGLMHCSRSNFCLINHCSIIILDVLLISVHLSLPLGFFFGGLLEEKMVEKWCLVVRYLKSYAWTYLCCLLLRTIWSSLSLLFGFLGRGVRGRENGWKPVFRCDIIEVICLNLSLQVDIESNMKLK